MSTLDALFQDFPERELAIRRRLKSDPCLRAICDDYCEAAAARRHWQAAGPDFAARAAQYRILAQELAEEIAAHLRRPSEDPPGRGAPPRSEADARRTPHDDRPPRR